MLVTSIIWGVAFVAQKEAMNYMGPFTFTGIRFALGGLALIPVVYFFERGRVTGLSLKTTVGAGACGGAVLFAAASLQQYGVQLTMSAGRSGFITGLYIVLVPILGVALKKKTNAFTWAGAFLATSGLYFLSAPDGLGSIGRGDIALVSGAFFWAAHIHLVGHFAERIRPVRFSIAQFLTCSALSMACAFIFEGVSAGAVISGYVPILYSALLSVGIAYTLQIVGQRHVAPAKAAIIFSLETIFSVLGGAVLLGETMDPRGYAGCGLIFAGIMASQIAPGKLKW